MKSITKKVGIDSLSKIDNYISKSLNFKISLVNCSLKILKVNSSKIHKAKNQTW